MPYKLIRYYKIEVPGEVGFSPIVSGFVSEIELSEAEFYRMDRPEVEEKLFKGQLEDLLIMKETLKEFFEDKEPLIVEINEKEYLQLFAAQTFADFPVNMRNGGILCTHEQLM